MHNINGLTKDQQSKAMNFMLTNEERLTVLAARGQRMTGYPVQQRPGTGGLFYYWSNGLQPSVELIEALGDKNPVTAAEKFLAAFLSGDGKTAYPVARPQEEAAKPDPKQTNDIDGVVEVSLCEFDNFLPQEGKTYRFVRNPHCAHCTAAGIALILAQVNSKTANAQG